MTQLLYANNAASTLAANISTSTTSITLATGTGALFATPASGQAFYATLYDAATKLNIEIVQVTNVTGDTFTVTRAQQGTSAKSYIVGDIIQQAVTKADLGNFVQQGAVTTATLLGISSGALTDVEPDGHSVVVASGSLSTAQKYGAGYYSAVGLSSNLTGTITFPAGAQKARVRGWAPGGRGGAGNGGFGSGGCGGGYFEGTFVLNGANLSAAYTVGAAVSSGADGATTGTSTSITYTPSSVSWYAVAGSNGYAGSASGGTGSGTNSPGNGNVSGDAFALLGGGGGYGILFDSTTGAGEGGTCGSAPFFANPAVASAIYTSTVAGQAGAFPGVGGGGGVGGGAGGTGAGGLLIVEWWS